MAGKRSSQLKKIIKRYWRSHLSDDIRFLAAASADDLQRDNLPKPHFHNTFTMSALEDGSLPISFHNGTVILHPGEILIIGHNIPHMVDLAHIDDACYYRTATINENLLDSSLLAKIKEAENTVSKISDKSLWEKFVSEQRNIESGDSYEINAMRHLSETMLSEISKNVLLRFQVSSPYIRQIMRYMEDNYMSSISIEELSKVVNLSPFHFTRLFKQEAGMSPHAYITQLRVNRAQDLILRGESLLGIAYELGFADQSHFSRTFLKLTGVSPVKFNTASKAD
ncbi:helix-turn-helix domain-containing protein [Cloacibacillus porcorum]|jgi:AraC-like DNA-binding protein|uniref:HTH araC/xylS-type domain-containing protein n=1 Tax=Cloacibacillus porcorum TaxID=1197717 RepID=A0A1B2I8K5_9BACT|nr:helix-turn-helix domain-containing protein [Cloacibacillus porcorum]ANZ46267.1 hypothetical protein BED41_14840 [Cloacibacillus porcorum]